MSAPGVSDDPVLSSILNTIPDDRDIVYYIKVASGVLVDTTSVSFKRIGNGNTASNGTALEYLLHHVLLTGDRSELIDLVHTVLVRNEAWATTWLAILANVDRSAFDAVVVTASLVNGAGLIGDIVLVHVLKGRDGFTTVAAVVVH